MNEDGLKALLSAGETDTLEFKEKINEGLFETISAFANTRGGIIILGVNNRGYIVGVEPSDKFLGDLTNRIVNKLSLYPGIEIFNLNGKRAIVINIPHTGNVVSFEGHYYERVGNTTREMKPEKLKTLLLKNEPWDSIICDAELDEIDLETFNRFVQLSVNNKRLTEDSMKDSPRVILEKLKFATNGRLTNGAVLLFGKNPQKYFINLNIRILRLKTETITIDDKWIEGNLFQQFNEAINLIRQRISVRYEIKDIQREDIWDYPIPSIREAILNAIIHRDYFNLANSTVIKIYDDHIWFFNPGGLTDGITLEELKRPHQSFLRNPLIAKAFYLSGYIEQYGSGTVRIIEWLKEAGQPEPEYKEEFGGFSVYFYMDVYTEENLRGMGLNDRQIKAVLYVKDKGKITNKEYQEVCNISGRTASRDLSYLVIQEILEQVGATGKGTNYVLMTPQRRQRRNNDATKTPESN